MDTLLQGIPHVCVYLDDILVTGMDEGNHKKSLMEVLKRLNKAGVRVKLSKCQFGVTEIQYLGFKINQEGLHPLPDLPSKKLEARRRCLKSEAILD